MVTKNSTTITLTGEEQTVQFDRAYPYFWVHNLGDGDVSISMDGGIVEGADGVITVPVGGSCCTMHNYTANADKLYLLGSGRVQVMGTGSALNPFKTSWKGGVDGTLSKAGYAADSKVVGDNINELSENVSNHTNNSDIHVTAADKNNWNGYATEIEKNKIVFSKLADFPAVGESNKIYIDTNTCKSYIFVNNTYQLVGDGTTDWGLIS